MWMMWKLWNFGKIDCLNILSLHYYHCHPPFPYENSIFLSYFISLTFLSLPECVLIVPGKKQTHMTFDLKGEQKKRWRKTQRREHRKTTSKEKSGGRWRGGWRDGLPLCVLTAVYDALCWTPNYCMVMEVSDEAFSRHFKEKMNHFEI